MSIRFINRIVTEENKNELIKKCDHNTVVNYVGSDFEIDFPKGFSIQFSASKVKNFAKPYSCPGVKVQKNFEPKEKWDYDFSFVGDIRPPIRQLFFMKFQSYLKERPHVRHRICLNDKQFSMYTIEQKNEVNVRHPYNDIMKETKFVLCPAGSGQQSIRFFEALALNNIPIFIGNPKTKLPLDWIIDWRDICYRVTKSDIVKNSYWNIFDTILKMSNDEINEKRENINKIYNEYLFQSKENVEKFENLIKQRIQEKML